MATFYPKGFARNTKNNVTLVLYLSGTVTIPLSHINQCHVSCSQACGSGAIAPMPVAMLDDV